MGLRVNRLVLLELGNGGLKQFEQVNGTEAEVGTTRVADADQTVFGNADLFLLLK